MMAIDFLRRTPFRLAALFTGLFVVTALVIFAGLYVALGRELEREIRVRITESAEAFAAIGREKGFSELADLIQSETFSTRDDDKLLLLTDDAGHFRAGNVRNIGQSAEWMTLARADIAPVPNRGHADDMFLARWFKIEGGRLLVGIIDREIRKTRMILLDGLLWALAATVLVAGMSSVALARNAQSRIGAVARTLEAVTRGQLDARVPMSGTGDDIDHIGGQINRTLNQLKTLVENVNQSSTDIAHDLKKPIGRLQRQLDVARTTAREPEEFMHAIDVALSDLESIVETFEALLNIAQIEAGARRSRFQAVDLRAVVDDICDVYAAVVEDSGQDLVVHNELDRPANVLGDKELLFQLIANLIENSIHHCPNHTRIELGLTAVEGGYEISVADDGPGIPPEERTNVLRRLYRLERSRSTPGSGLGLSFVSAITELHGARLKLEDNSPGLRVSITFSKKETSPPYKSVASRPDAGKVQGSSSAQWLANRPPEPNEE